MKKETTKKATTSTAKAKKENNMKTTQTVPETTKTPVPEDIVFAQIRNVYIPRHMQINKPEEERYDNVQLFISKTNMITKSFDYEVDSKTNEPKTNVYGHRIIRKDENNMPLYKITDNTQILWERTDGVLFITTFKQKVVKTEEIPGEAGDTIQTVVKDYIREYLLSRLSTQHDSLNLKQTNTQIINTMLKYRDDITYMFIRKDEVNGKYINTKYYAKYIREENLPETTVDIPVTTELPEETEL